MTEQQAHKEARLKSIDDDVRWFVLWQPGIYITIDEETLDARPYTRRARWWAVGAYYKGERQ